MNKTRRAALNALQDRITELKQKLDEIRNLAAEAQEIYDELEGIESEEQDYFNSMPEAFQNGDKGNTAIDAINQMQQARDELGGLIEVLDVDQMDTYADAAFEAIEEAKGAA